MFDNKPEDEYEDQVNLKFEGTTQHFDFVVVFVSSYTKLAK